MAQRLMNPTRNHEVWGSIPGLPQWVKGSGIAVTCGVGRRWSLDPMLLWLWYRPAATALIRSLVWEHPYVMDAALEKRQKDKRGKKKSTAGRALSQRAVLPGIFLLAWALTLR